jgi:hypothetical protein
MPSTRACATEPRGIDKAPRRRIRYRRFGAAEFDVIDGNFQPIPGTNCLSFTKEDDVTLLGTGSTLVLVGSGTLSAETGSRPRCFRP